MTSGRDRQFSQTVERYRRALFYFARISDWDTFKTKAGRLFDYVESIEFSELERRFFKNFGAVLAMLIGLAIALFNVDFAATPQLQHFKNLMVLAGLAMGSFELIFYINYRTYVRIRMVRYAERRANFIRNIERDFVGYVVRTEMQKAA
jgi:hypothetical protein